MAWRQRPAAAAALSDARALIVRPDFRKAVVAAVIYAIAATAAVAFGGVHARHTVVNKAGQRVSEAYRSHQIASLVAIGICAAAGFIAVRLVADELARIARHRGSAAAASSLRLTIQIIGYLIVLITVLALLSVKVQSVLLSGAIGSVVIGLAAQQTLSNLFAGVVLLVSRPFLVGDYITVRAGALGGQIDGDVVGITLMFTQLQTTDGPMSLPNATVLASATGRRPRPAEPDRAEPDPAEPTAPSGATNPPSAPTGEPAGPPSA
ncbi:MAG: small conductance mechanosensitive channel [Actinomycetota bacterium]|nr:small conductance mechanosensitive channel [Actinomycetota bacterium]